MNSSRALDAAPLPNGSGFQPRPGELDPVAFRRDDCFDFCARLRTVIALATAQPLAADLAIQRDTDVGGVRVAIQTALSTPSWFLD